MRLQRLLGGAAIALAFSALAASANASSLTFALPDIGTFEGYTIDDNGQTYSGNGFLGLYSNGQFGHLFGLEGDSSRTVAQADISSLLGANITSATFSFDLLEAYNPGTTTTVTGYGGTGALGYLFSAPGGGYGTSSTVLAAGFNSFDVTAIVAAAAGSANGNLNLFFENSESSDWTYTYSGFGYGLDRANARLTVEYSSGGVPEPATWALMIGGFGLAGASLRCRRAVATAA